jgi:hypothetical protein
VKNHSLFFIVISILVGCSNLNAAGARPAMVGSGGDSLAGQVHYPDKAKAAH